MTFSISLQHTALTCNSIRRGAISSRAVCNYISFDALAMCDSACERSQLTPSNVLTTTDCTVPGSIQATVTALPSGFERGM